MSEWSPLLPSSLAHGPAAEFFFRDSDLGYVSLTLHAHHDWPLKVGD